MMQKIPQIVQTAKQDQEQFDQSKIEREKDFIKVFIRIRQPLQEQIQSNIISYQIYQNQLSIKNNSNSISSNTILNYKFDHIFSRNKSIKLKQEQQNIFQKIGKPLVQNSLNGYNGCIFVYGQTGSGKTYTMTGINKKNLENKKLKLDLQSHFEFQQQSNEEGLIQKCFRYLFNKISKLNQTIKQQQENKLKVKCSYFQIYNQQIFDLLQKRSQKNAYSSSNLCIRQDIQKQPYIQNLSYHSARSQKQLTDLLLKGIKNRKIGQTECNHESSRSHSIFQIIIQQRLQNCFGENFKNSQKWVTSKICFVDLAGSQRQKQTLAKGKLLKQANNINLSLTNLGIVINSLSKSCENSQKVIKQKKNQQNYYIPYRNSKLTYILKNSLSKNSKTFLIATLSSNLSSYSQTLSTLKFANRVKMIPISININQNIKIVKKVEDIRLHSFLPNDISQNQKDCLSIKHNQKINDYNYKNNKINQVKKSDRSKKIQKINHTNHNNKKFYSQQVNEKKNGILTMKLINGKIKQKKFKSSEEKRINHQNNQQFDFLNENKVEFSQATSKTFHKNSQQQSIKVLQNSIKNQRDFKRSIWKIPQKQLDSSNQKQKQFKQKNFHLSLKNFQIQFLKANLKFHIDYYENIIIEKDRLISNLFNEISRQNINSIQLKKSQMIVQKQRQKQNMMCFRKNKQYLFTTYSEKQIVQKNISNKNYDNKNDQSQKQNTNQIQNNIKRQNINFQFDEQLNEIKKRKIYGRKIRKLII